MYFCAPCEFLELIKAREGTGSVEPTVTRRLHVWVLETKPSPLQEQPRTAFCVLGVDACLVSNLWALGYLSCVV